MFYDIKQFHKITLYCNLTMFETVLQKQTSNVRPDRFKHLLAQYRSRVYEANYNAFTNSSVSSEAVIQIRSVNPTILVVEDNVDEWVLIRHGLRRQFPEADCAWLDKAAEVIPYLDTCVELQTILPRLLLLDLYLPGSQNGMRILEMLKTHPHYQSIPTVVFSRSADPADIANAYTYSANAYVVKPSEYSQWQAAFAELEPYWKQPTIDR